MDNISHSIVGLATGEFIHRSLLSENKPEDQSARRRLLLLSTWLASNFPDLDLIFTDLLPPPLAYLLHHRGHTHTLFYAIPQGLLIALLIWLIWPEARRLLKSSVTVRIGIAISITIGLLLHIAMDYLNAYGVHPFHPFDSHWFYGDMVFIVEPAFWVIFGIPLLMTLKPRWIKALLITLFVSALLLFTMKGFLLWTSPICLLGIAIALGYLHVYLDSDHKNKYPFIVAGIVSISFILAQSIASHYGRLEIIRNIHETSPKSRILDIAMTAFPSNPFCWSFVSIENNEHQNIYRLRQGFISLIPRLLDVRRCPSGFVLDRGNLTDSSSINTTNVYEGNLENFRKLAHTNCVFSSWLRFSRMPYLDKSIASDLRYSSGSRKNFTTMDLHHFSPDKCFQNTPQWSSPREDLLER